MFRRDVALVVATERGHDADLGDGHVHLLQRFDPPLGLGECLGDRAIGVGFRERLARRDAQAALDVELLRADGARHALRVEIDARVARAGTSLESRGHLLGVGHLRHPLGTDEGRDLDLGKYTIGQQIHEPDLLAGGDGRFLDLHAFAWTKLMNDDAFGQSHERLRQVNRVSRQRALGEGASRQQCRRQPAAGH